MTKLTEGDLIERKKNILFLKGTHSSQILTDVMKDLSLLSKPYNKVLNKKNEILPFEDPSSLEFLSSKNECGLFTFASHSKKRPNNLVMVRCCNPCTVVWEY
jgi:ribosome production factor 2